MRHHNGACLPITITQYLQSALLGRFVIFIFGGRDFTSLHHHLRQCLYNRHRPHTHFDHAQDEFEDVTRVAVLAAPIVRIVFNARVFVDADLVLVDDPAQRGTAIDDVFVCFGRDVFDRDMAVVFEFGEIAFAHRTELVDDISLTP